MNTNLLLSEKCAVLGTIDPDALTAGAHNSDWVSLADFQQIMAVIMVGTLGTSATVDAKLQEATDSSGTGAKDISGKSITQLTEAGSDDDKQAIINCRAEELDFENDFTHVRLVVTVAVATSDGGALLLGAHPRYDTADAHDLASVDEIVA